MPQRKPVEGLEPRLRAAQRLDSVLGGEPFRPFAASEIADPRDRALTNRLVTTALRRHGHIDMAIAAVLARGLPARAGLFHSILRIAIAQLLFLDDIPAHSALHLAVEAVRRDRRAGRYDKLMNGALRQIQRRPEIAGAFAPPDLFPTWLGERWSARYGAGAVADFAAALLAGAPLDLTLKADDPALVSALGATPVLGDTVRVARRDAGLTALAGYREGAWWVQDAASALPARLFGDLAGKRALDLCAAPGGKTAQLVKAGAATTALDVDAGRMDRLAGNLERLGYTAERVVGDALAYRPEPLFDAVLLDAPCSATGTFRRHPEVVWLRDEGGIAGRVALQRALIAHAARLLAPGAMLVYCVCSLEAEEGEDQARWATGLEGLEPAPVTAAELGGWAQPVTPEGWLRTHPAMQVPGAAGGTLDGFFVARFRRTAL